MSKPNSTAKRGSLKWILWLVILLVIGAGLWGSYAFLTKEIDPLATKRYETFAVQRGPLRISVIEPGTFRSREQEIIKNEVEGRNTLIYIIPEGTLAKKGDLLAEIDSSLLQDDQVESQILSQKAEAAFVSSREALEVAKNQANSDVSKAELDLRFARMNIDKYLKGEYPQALQQAEAEITMAREDLQRATEKLTWSRKLADEKYITRTELQADELAANKCSIDLELAEGRLTLLKDYTHIQMVAELESAVEQAEMALDRVKRKANADVIQAEADLTAKQSEFDRQKAKLEKIQAQIKACRMFAPRDGFVVYATTGQGRGGDEPLKEGAEVRERQELIYLPIASSVMVKAKTHEANLEKVSVGLPVRITADALQGRSFTGRVTKIAPLPDAQSYWMNPDLKVFDTEIEVDGDGSNLRTGLSCYAEIIVAEYPDANYIPVSCVFLVSGVPTVYVLKDGVPEPRRVEIGLDNNQMIHIISGLEPNEEVLMSPPLTPGSEGVSDATPQQSMPQDLLADKDSRAPHADGATLAKSDSDQNNGNDTQEISLADWRKLSPEERQKKLEGMPEDQQEEFKKTIRKRARPDESESETDDNSGRTLNP